MKKLPKPKLKWTTWTKEDGIWTGWIYNTRRALLRAIELYVNGEDTEGPLRVRIVPVAPKKRARAKR